MHALLSLLIAFFTRSAYATDPLLNLNQALLNGDIFFPLAMAFVAGLLTSFSPCVYPLIPITLSVMGARTYQNHRQGFLVALSYVLGMSLLYATLGALFASFGIILGSFMQHPIMLLTIAVFFLLMALSMLNAIDFMPTSLLTKLSRVGGSGFKGAFLMGMVAGLLAAPCTGPVLGVILTLIAGRKDILLGSILMLSFSFGMGFLFLVLGTFSQALSRLPKSGDWMQTIKTLLGAVMLGVALYYFALAEPELLPFLRWAEGFNQWWLIGWGLGGVLLLVTEGRAKNIMRRRIFVGFSVGIIAVSLASILSLSLSAPPVVHESSAWHVIDADTRDEGIFDRLVTQAQKDNKSILIDFYADWCAACIQLEKKTFVDPLVFNRLKDFVLIKVDSSKNAEHLVKLQNRFSVTGLPTLILLHPTQKQERILGFMPPHTFLERIEKGDY